MVSIADKVVRFQMKYFISKADEPVLYESCGNLVSEDHFLHMRRTCTSFVLLAVQKGVLYITQEGREYAIGENQVFLLEEGKEHFGHRPSEGELSYYWVHFRFSGSWKGVAGEETAPYPLDGIGESDCYVLPQYFSLPSPDRVTLLLVQLLDMARRDNFAVTLRTRYAASLVLLELTQENIHRQNTKRRELPPALEQVMEWIQANYGRNITANSVADRFGYNPTYLSALFKKYTGYPLIPYLNRLRVSVSKNLLTNQSLKIYTIASMCGFADEKHYMKLFKRYEGMTPSQYRQAFFQKKINR